MLPTIDDDEPAKRSEGLAGFLAILDGSSSCRRLDEGVRAAGLMATCMGERRASEVGRRPRCDRNGNVGVAVRTSVMSCCTARPLIPVGLNRGS